MSVQNVAVSVHVQEQILTGVVSLAPGRRLSDYLNSDLIGQSNSTCTFLKLTDVTILRADGVKERVETVYVNVEAIQILRTVDKDSTRGIGANDGPKQYPFVKKLPVRVAMRMSDYEINGYLHCRDVQGIPQLFAQELAFLPCTDVKVRRIGGDGYWDADFVAVNRRQVYSFQSGGGIYSQIISSQLQN